MVNAIYMHIYRNRFCYKFALKFGKIMTETAYCIFMILYKYIKT